MMKDNVIDLFGNNKNVPNEGEEYSNLLKQFMSPFTDDFKVFDYMEDVYEFAISAWNFSNIKTLIPPEELEKSRMEIPKDDISFDLLEKMIDYKGLNFKEYDNFIVDFEIEEEDSGDPILRVLTQEKEVFLSNMLIEMDEEDVLQHSDDDFEENYVDRYAIILKPQQPFIDWYTNLDPEEDFDEDIHKIKTYLIDEEIDDVEKWLKKRFDKFFKFELGAWNYNKKDWPKKRSYKMFKQWFRVEISEMIYDFEKKPVLKYEY